MHVWLVHDIRLILALLNISYISFHCYEYCQTKRHPSSKHPKWPRDSIMSLHDITTDWVPSQMRAMCRSQFGLKTCSDRVAVIRGERGVVGGSSVWHYQYILSLTYPDIIQKFKQFKNFVLFGSHSFLIFPWYIIIYSVVACQLSCE